MAAGHGSAGRPRRGATGKTDTAFQNNRSPAVCLASVLVKVGAVRHNPKIALTPGRRERSPAATANSEPLPMSLLGKILLVFNLLAGGGFFYLATQDWKGRQNITAVALRHLLVLQGVPLDGKDFDTVDDETPFVVEMAGGESTKTVGKKVLDTYFASAGAAAAPAGGVALGGNMAVTNQASELKRVRVVIDTAVNAAEGGTKVALLANFLLMQAESFEERAALLALINAGNAGDLAVRLAAKFDAVIAAPRNPDVNSLAPKPDDNATQLDERLKAVRESRSGPTADESQRRERLAHLLVHLDRDPAWQKRVMMVVGLRRYVQALGAQTVRFAEMSARVKRDVEADDARFVSEYALLRDQSIKNTQLVNDAAANRRKLEEQLTNDQGFVTQRQTQLNKLKADLLKVKADVDELIANQTTIEKVLFEVQREVGLTLDEVYRLEAELEKKERERFKNP